MGSERPLPAGDHGPLIEPETHRPSPGPGHSRTDCVLRTPTSTGEGANRPFRGTSRDSQEPAPPRTNRQTPKSRTGGTIQPPSPRTPIRAGEPGEEPGIKIKSARKIGLKIIFRAKPTTSMKTFALKAIQDWCEHHDCSVVNRSLTAFILAVHIFSEAGGWGEVWRDTLGLQPGKLYTCLTYAMLHGVPGKHIAENALLLVLIGPPVEKTIGPCLYGLAVAGLVILGAVASVTWTRDHWPDGENLIGLSGFTYALITAGVYLLALKVIGQDRRTGWHRWIAVGASATVCAVLVYGIQGPQLKPATVVHTTAFLGGTIIAVAHAFLFKRSRDDNSVL